MDRIMGTKLHSPGSSRPSSSRSTSSTAYNATFASGQRSRASSQELAPSSELLLELIEKRKAETRRLSDASKSSNGGEGSSSDGKAVTNSNTTLRPSKMTRAQIEKSTGIKLEEVDAAGIAGMGAKTMATHINELKKESFRLKLDLHYTRKQIDSLQEELETQRSEAKLAVMAADQAARELAEVQQENIALQTLNEEILVCMTQKDTALQEAVDMICALQSKSPLHPLKLSNDLKTSEEKDAAKATTPSEGAVSPLTGPFQQLYVAADNASDDRLRLDHNARHGTEAESPLVSPVSSPGSAPSVDSPVLSINMDSPVLSMLSESSFRTIYSHKRRMEAASREELLRRTTFAVRPVPAVPNDGFSLDQSEEGIENLNNHSTTKSSAAFQSKSTRSLPAKQAEGSQSKTTEQNRAQVRFSGKAQYRLITPRKNTLVQSEEAQYYANTPQKLQAARIENMRYPANMSPGAYSTHPEEVGYNLIEVSPETQAITPADARGPKSPPPQMRLDRLMSPGSPVDCSPIRPGEQSREFVYQPSTPPSMKMARVDEVCSPSKKPTRQAKDVLYGGYSPLKMPGSWVEYGPSPVKSTHTSPLKMNGNRVESSPASINPSASRTPSPTKEDGGHQPVLKRSNPFASIGGILMDRDIFAPLEPLNSMRNSPRTEMLAFAEREKRMALVPTPDRDTSSALPPTPDTLSASNQGDWGESPANFGQPVAEVDQSVNTTAPRAVRETSRLALPERTKVSRAINESPLLSRRERMFAPRAVRESRLEVSREHMLDSRAVNDSLLARRERNADIWEGAGKALASGLMGGHPDLNEGRRSRAATNTGRYSFFQRA